MTIAVSKVETPTGYKTCNWRASSACLPSLIHGLAETNWDLRANSVERILASRAFYWSLVDTLPTGEEVIGFASRTVVRYVIVVDTVRCEASRIPIDEGVTLHTFKALILVSTDTISCLAYITVKPEPRLAIGAFAV
jgi:hypothetical protein